LKTFLKTEARIIMKYIVFDSSSIISMTASNLDFILEEMSKKKVKFCIPQGVYDEIVKPGEASPTLGWSSGQIQYLIKNKILEVLNLEFGSEYEHIDNLVNNIFYTRYGPLQILQRGELESIFLIKKLGEKSLFCIDELITRKIIDDPYKLKDLLAKRYKTKLMMDENKLREFKVFIDDIKVVRSVDLVAYAFKNKYLSKFGNDSHLLRSILYSLKDNGCAVLHEEIDKYVEKL